MDTESLPPSAVWRHHTARDGFEVLFTDVDGSGARLRGSTAAREGGTAWAVQYVIGLDAQWRTRTARVTGDTEDGQYAVTVEHGDNGWLVDGRSRPDLDGCVDIDLECSAVTNALPLRRLALEDGTEHAVPAVFVHAATGEVSRLEQTYRLLGTEDDRSMIAYTSATFDFGTDLTYDSSGLIIDYPGLATRV